MTIKEDPHVSAVIASLMGGFLYGLARIFAVAFAPTPASARAVRNAIAQAGASVVSACIGGYYVVPALLYACHIKEPDLKGLISVLIGIGFWQAIPGIQAIVDRFLLGWIARLLGVKQTGTEHDAVV